MSKTDVQIEKLNSAFIRLNAERSILQELSDHFTFYVPDAHWHPAFKAKRWDGKIRLINLNNRTTYSGLSEKIKSFCEKNGYTCVIPDSKNNGDFDADSYELSLSLVSNGKPIKTRISQKTGFVTAVKNKDCILVSPTSSGKSLIAYLLTRWYLDFHQNDKKVLVIVPNLSLVNQMYSDFADYSFENGWSIKQNCHKICGGEFKDSDKPVYISTWQSIYKMPKDYFNKFGMVISDECHMYKAESLRGIMEKCLYTDYRIGMTGTLDGMKCNEMMLEGMFGPIYKITSTKEMMDRKEISELKIDMLFLKYTDQEKNLIKRAKYQEEISWLVNNKRRNEFLLNLANATKGNTLLLFNYVESHIIPFHEELKRRTKKPVYIIHGNIDGETRETIRNIIEKENEAIIIGSYGCMSTGVSIKRLHNIVFAHPTKSIIRVLQSIGRGLRLGEGKTHAKLIDIVDDLRIKSYENYSFKHGIERCEIYESEKLEYKTVSIKI